MYCQVFYAPIIRIIVFCEQLSSVVSFDCEKVRRIVLIAETDRLFWYLVAFNNILVTCFRKVNFVDATPCHLRAKKQYVVIVRAKI